MSFKKITENESLHKDLEQKSSLELLNAINQEDQKVALALIIIAPFIVESLLMSLKMFSN